MHTVIVSIVLASSMLAGHAATAPTFQTSYVQAQQQGAAQSKPLAVIFGSGNNGWTQIVRDAAPSDEVNTLLAQKYVCVYVDTASPTGKQLAQNFAVQGNVGIVLSDRAGTTQAFWHQGDMSNGSLESYLVKYADPNSVVRTTETANTSRTSFYPPTATTSPAGGDWNSMFNPSYCPSCNNARSRR